MKTDMTLHSDFNAQTGIGTPHKQAFRSTVQVVWTNASPAGADTQKERKEQKKGVSAARQGRKFQRVKVPLQ